MLETTGSGCKSNDAVLASTKGLPSNSTMTPFDEDRALRLRVGQLLAMVQTILDGPLQKKNEYYNPLIQLIRTNENRNNQVE